MQVRPRERAREAERCVVCHDASSGLVACRGCGALLHAQCLVDVRGCPTLGCGEKDPLQYVPAHTGVLCEVCEDKGYYLQGDRERKQYCLWCKKGREWAARRADVDQFIGDNVATNAKQARVACDVCKKTISLGDPYISHEGFNVCTADECRRKAHLVRDLRGPFQCKHEYSGNSTQCVYCGRSAADLFREGLTSASTWAALVQQGADDLTVELVDHIRHQAKREFVRKCYFAAFMLIFLYIAVELVLAGH